MEVAQDGELKMTTNKKKAKRKKRPVKKAQAKNNRLNLRIDLELRGWAHEYAQRHQTTITALITEYFVHLRETEHVVNVRQI